MRTNSARTLIIYVFVAISAVLLFWGFPSKHRMLKSRNDASPQNVKIDKAWMRALYEEYSTNRAQHLKSGRQFGTMEDVGLRSTESALRNVNHPWTSTPILNATVAAQEVNGLRLIGDRANVDMDALYFNSPDPLQAVAFFLDPIWNRILYCNKSEQWIKSYGEWNGAPRYEFHLRSPRALAVDISPLNDIYVTDTEHGRILKLKYGVTELGGEGSFSFDIPGVEHPVDISIPVDQNGIWVADDQTGRLVEVTRGNFVLQSVTQYKVGELVYTTMSPLSVAADSWPWPRAAFVDSRQNAFIVFDPTVERTPSDAPVTAINFSRFTQPGSHIEHIGLDLCRNWWVADPGLNLIHTFSYDGEYLASFAPPVGVHKISTSPCYRTSGGGIEQPYYIYSAEPWSNSNGLRAYVPGADLVVT